MAARRLFVVVAILLFCALPAFADGDGGASEESVGKITKLQAQLQQCEAASLKTKEEAAEEKKKLKDSCDKGVADLRASAQQDVRAVEEQLQLCKDGSTTAEKEAAARQKKLADDLKAAAEAHEQEIVQIHALLSPLTTAAKDASLALKVEKAVARALQADELDAKVQGLQRELSATRSTASHAASCEGKLNRVAEDAEATIGQLQAALLEKGQRLEQVHGDWLPPWLSDRLAALQLWWANETLPLILNAQQKFVNSTLSAVQPVLSRVHATIIEDIQPRLLTSASAAVCASHPYLLLAVNLTEAAAQHGAALPGTAWRLAGPHVQAGSARVREAVAQGSSQAWQRVSPELQQKLLRARETVEGAVGPAWKSTVSALQPVWSTVHSHLHPHARSLHSSLQSSLSALSNSTSHLPSHLRASLALCVPDPASPSSSPPVLPAASLAILAAALLTVVLVLLLSVFFVIRLISGGATYAPRSARKKAGRSGKSSHKAKRPKPAKLT